MWISVRELIWDRIALDNFIEMEFECIKQSSWIFGGGPDAMKIIPI